jgi:chromosome segregation ATPase
VAAWALAVCLAAALAGIVYLVRVTTRQAAEVARLARENGELRARAAAQSAGAVVPPAPEVARAAPHAGQPRAAAAAPDQSGTLDRLRASLAETSSSMRQLDARVQELQVQVQKLTVDNQRLSASESYHKDELASVNRVVEAQRAELKTRTDRVVQLEIAAQKLREQNTASSGRLARIAQLSAELQEVHRRREDLLNTVLRRYRQVTEQYTAMAGAMENRTGRDRPAAAGTDVARIQNTLSLVEDDLGQLNSLNAQALRLQKQIAGK